MLEIQVFVRARSRALASTGNRSAANNEMIPSTTSSSIRVNPVRFICVVVSSRDRARLQRTAGLAQRERVNNDSAVERGELVCHSRKLYSESLPPTEARLSTDTVLLDLEHF